MKTLYRLKMKFEAVVFFKLWYNVVIDQPS